MNLGLRCGDDIAAVAHNREKLQGQLPAAPQWLHQVHGNRVVSHLSGHGVEPEGDAVVTFSAGQVCAVLTADCLPVLFCNDLGNRIAVAHAGWRGLARDVLKATVMAMEEKSERIMVWLGPAIGPMAYEVGEDVRQDFGDEAAGCFSRHGDRWLFDLYAIARLKLDQLGIKRIFGGGFCTFSDHERFFSYRRDRVTGRMASLIWMSEFSPGSPVRKVNK
jgi:YfiH family protein